MIFFDKKPAICSICNKQTKHKHKPKREWSLKGPLCGDCYVDKMKEYYEASMKQKCAVCQKESKISNLWEPRWQWEMEGLLCKECFDKKESEFTKKKETCSVCGVKLNLFRYNPKSEWKMDGQLCRKCWDVQKQKFR